MSELGWIVEEAKEMRIAGQDYRIPPGTYANAGEIATALNRQGGPIEWFVGEDGNLTFRVIPPPQIEIRPFRTPVRRRLRREIIPRRNPRRGYR